MKERKYSEYYDVSYAMVTVSLTSTGKIVITTTSAFYHGVSMIANSSRVTVTIYDTINATGGNIIDILRVNPGGQLLADKYNPVVAKNGITAKVVGSDGEGTVFYGPKG